MAILRTQRLLLRSFRDLKRFPGTETAAVQNLQIGGWGCISATTNVSAPLVSARISEIDSDASSVLDQKIIDVRQAISSINNVGGTKAALSAFLGNRDWARTLPPNVGLGIERANELANKLDELAELRKYFH